MDLDEELERLIAWLSMPADSAIMPVVMRPQALILARILADTRSWMSDLIAQRVGDETTRITAVGAGDACGTDDSAWHDAVRLFDAEVASANASADELERVTLYRGVDEAPPEDAVTGLSAALDDLAAKDRDELARTLTLVEAAQDEIDRITQERVHLASKIEALESRLASSTQDLDDAQSKARRIEPVIKALHGWITASKHSRRIDDLLNVDSRLIDAFDEWQRAESAALNEDFE